MDTPNAENILKDMFPKKPEKTPEIKAGITGYLCLAVIIITGIALAVAGFGLLTRLFIWTAGL